MYNPFGKRFFEHIYLIPLLNYALLINEIIVGNVLVTRVFSLLLSGKNTALSR